MIILLDVGLNVPRPSTHVVGVVGTTEAADMHQVRSDMSYLRTWGTLQYNTHLFLDLISEVVKQWKSPNC